MKRVISLVLCSMMIIASFAACSTKNTPKATPSPSPATTVSPSPEASMAPEGSKAPEGSWVTSPAPGGTGAATANIELTKIRDTMKETYGEDYIPDRAFTEEEIKERFGLTPDMYDEVLAEGSTLEENPDIFVAVKAKEGKADEVEKILNDHKNTMATDNKYEANTERIKAAQVTKNGNYVFMVLLGKNTFGEEVKDLGEGIANEIKKGVDAIGNMFR